MRLFAVSVVCALCLGGTSGAGGVDGIVSNGSFEQPRELTGNFTLFEPGSRIGAWRVGGEGVDLLGRGWGAAHGDQAVDLNAQGPGSISQTLDTTPGTSYQLRFEFSGNPAGGPVTVRARIKWDGRVIGKETFNTTGRGLGNLGWRPESFAVKASGSRTRLVFESLSDAGAGPLIDHVRVISQTPVLGRSVAVGEVGGSVLVRVGRRFVPLEEARRIPVNALIDARRGTVRLTSARARGNKTQSGRFSGGIFKVRQSRRGADRGVTELRLQGGNFKNCSAGEASASKRRYARRRVRRLRGRARGRYRTRGRHSAATVRGTNWEVIDRCDGTLTTVKSGTVVVRDFRRRRTVTVRAGKKYFARAG